jgi:hypothetical protein
VRNQFCIGTSPLIATMGGAVLLVCLLMLAALTLLGIAAAWDHILQDRMSVNLSKRAQAGEFANAALAWGEDWLMGTPGSTRPPPCPGPCTSAEVIRSPGAFGPLPQFQDAGWWASHGFRAGTDPETGAILNPQLAGLDPPAFWIIEELHVEATNEAEDPASETGFYRLLSRGSTGNSPGYAVTESIVARPWGDAVLTSGFPASAPHPGFCRELAFTGHCGRQAWRQVQ